MAINQTRRQRLGLVVEGKSEYFAIPELLKRLRTEYTTPAKFDGLGSEMPVRAIAGRIVGLVRAQARKHVYKVLVLLDRESRDTCAPEFAGALHSELLSALAQTHDHVRISVVVADRKLENWLIADPSGLSTHALVELPRGHRASNNVDGHDGEERLKRLMKSGHSYEKGQMTGTLAKVVRIERSEVQARSRSLRKFIREVLQENAAAR